MRTACSPSYPSWWLQHCRSLPWRCCCMWHCRKRWQSQQTRYWSMAMHDVHPWAYPQEPSPLHPCQQPQVKLFTRLPPRWHLNPPWHRPSLLQYLSVSAGEGVCSIACLTEQAVSMSILIISHVMGVETASSACLSSRCNAHAAAICNQNIACKTPRASTECE